MLNGSGGLPPFLTLTPIIWLHVEQQIAMPPLRTIIIMTTTVAVVIGVAVLVIPPAPTTLPSSSEKTSQFNTPITPETHTSVAINNSSIATISQSPSTPATGFSFPAPPPTSKADKTTPTAPVSESVNEDERLVQLRSPDASVRIQTLDLIWESADRLDDRLAYADHVAKLMQDPDPQVAELATRLTAFLQADVAPNDDSASQTDELITLDEVDPTLTGDWVEPPPIEEAEQELSSEVPSDNIALVEPNAPPDSTEQLDQLYDDILNNPDSQARYEAIARSVEMANTRTLEVLTQAVNDAEANNRLAALEGLEQLLQQGIATTEQLTSTLQQTTTDPDERVATLATRLLQEHNEPI